MNPPRFLVCTALCLAFAACSLGPAYRRPAAEMPGAYQAARAAGPTPPAPAWWRGFGAPELDRLMDDASRGSFDIAAAIARVRQADQQVRIAGAPLLPAANFNGEAQYTRSGTGAGAAGAGLGSSAISAVPTGSKSHYVDRRFYDLLPSASYQLDFWGGLRATQQNAEASALYSRFDQQTVALTTLSSVATTYFTALAYEDRLAVAQRNLRDAQDVLNAIQARAQAGTASLLDVSQQEALAAGIRAQIPGLRSQAEQQIIALAILVGRPPERIDVPPGTLATLTLPEVQPGLPTELLERRPDIASAEAQLIAANANIRVARANFFPQITLTAQGGYESAGLSTLISPSSALLQLTAGIAQTVFDNGLKGGQYQQYKARYDELLADYEKAVVQALSDVENALVGYRYATEQEALQRQAVDTAQRAADIARAQVAAGTSDIVTALQAETTLFSDLDTLAQVRLNRFLALVDLYKALGGGWTRTDVAVPPSTIFHGIL